MATEKDSQRILCPWFDKNEIKHLHEWLTTFFADALGADQVLEMRDLLDVDFDDNQEGMVLYNSPISDTAGWNIYRWPYYVMNIDPGLTNTSGQPNGQHVIYNMTGAPATYSWNSEPTNNNPAMFTVYNSSGGVITITPDTDVVVVWPEGTTLSGFSATLSTTGQYVTFIKTGSDEWIAIGNPDGSTLSTPDVGDASNGNIARWQGPSELSYSLGSIDANGVMSNVKRRLVANTSSASMVLDSSNSGETIVIDRATETSVSFAGDTVSGTNVTFIQKGAGKILFTGTVGSSGGSHTRSANAGSTVFANIYNPTGATAIVYISGNTGV